MFRFCINTRLTVDQYRYLLEDSRSKAVFVSTALLPLIEEAAVGLPDLKTIVVVGGGPASVPRLDTLLAAENEGSAPARTCADDVAYWLYSSGTTGMPKGVMHVHSSPRFLAESAGKRRIGYREDDVVFSAAKLFFSYGLGNAMFLPDVGRGDFGILSGATDPADRIRGAAGLSADNVFRGSDALRGDSCRSGMRAGKRCPDRLRLCFSAGEPLPAHIGAAWKERFGLDIVNGVGSTEMGHLFLTNLPKAVEYGTSGTPVHGYKLRLVDEEGRDVSDNEIGELLVNGEFGGSRLLEPTRENHVAPLSASGPEPATNTFGVRTGFTHTAAAPTICSRSAGFGYRRSKSKKH